MPHRRGDRPSRDRLYHRRSCPARAAGSCSTATPSTTRSPTKVLESPSSLLVITPTTSSVRASRRSSKSSASRRLLMTAWTCPTSRNIELTSPSSRPTRILSKARGVFLRDLRRGPSPRPPRPQVLRLPEEARRRAAAPHQTQPHLNRVLRPDDGARRRLDRLLSVWKATFYGAFHAIDAALARWRGDAGSSPFDGTRHTGRFPHRLL